MHRTYAVDGSIDESAVVEEGSALQSLGATPRTVHGRARLSALLLLNVLGRSGRGAQHVFSTTLPTSEIRTT